MIKYLKQENDDESAKVYNTNCLSQIAQKQISKRKKCQRLRNICDAEIFRRKRQKSAPPKKKPICAIHFYSPFSSKKKKYFRSFDNRVHKFRPRMTDKKKGKKKHFTFISRMEEKFEWLKFSPPTHDSTSPSTIELYYFKSIGTTAGNRGKLRKTMKTLTNIYRERTRTKTLRIFRSRVNRTIETFDPSPQYENAFVSIKFHARYDLWLFAGSDNDNDKVKKAKRAQAHKDTDMNNKHKWKRYALRTRRKKTGNPGQEPTFCFSALSFWPFAHLVNSILAHFTSERYKEIKRARGSDCAGVALARGT